MDLYLRHLIYTFLPLDYEKQDNLFGQNTRDKDSSDEENTKDEGDDIPSFGESESPEELALKRQLFKMLRSEANQKPEAGDSEDA